LTRRRCGERGLLAMSGRGRKPELLKRETPFTLDRKLFTDLHSLGDSGLNAKRDLRALPSSIDEEREGEEKHASIIPCFHPRGQISEYQRKKKRILPKIENQHGIQQGGQRVQ